MMYWSDWGNVPRIEKASMDGANRTVIHNTSLVWPNALTLDIQTQTLYWADASLDTVESSGVDGSNRQILADTGFFHPFGIGVYDNEVYFTDWGLLTILNVNNSDTTASILTNPNFFCSQPAGIQIVHQTKQPICK